MRLNTYKGEIMDNREKAQYHLMMYFKILFEERELDLDKLSIEDIEQLANNIFDKIIRGINQDTSKLN